MSNKTGIPKKPFFGWLELSDQDQLTRVKALIASASGVPETCSGWFTVKIVNPGGFTDAFGTYYAFGSSLSISPYCEFEVVARDQRELLVRLTSAPQNAGAQGALCFISNWTFKDVSWSHARFLREVEAERAKVTSLFAKRHPTPRAATTLTLKRKTEFFWTKERLSGAPVAHTLDYSLPAGSTLTEISRDDESVLAVFNYRPPLNEIERKRLKLDIELNNGCPEGVMVVTPVSEFDNL